MLLGFLTACWLRLALPGTKQLSLLGNVLMLHVGRIRAVLPQAQVQTAVLQATGELNSRPHALVGSCMC
jgi:hypothetical protein